MTPNQVNIFTDLGEAPRATDKAIRRMAAKRPNGRLATFLSIIQSQGEGSIGLAGGPSGASETANSSDHDGYIIRWKSGTTKEYRDSKDAENGYRVRETYKYSSNRRDEEGETYELIEADREISDEQLARTFASDRNILGLEKNWIYTIQVTLAANDSYVTSGQTWGLATSPGINAAGFWANDATWSQYLGGSTNAYGAVVDEGVFFSHADLAGQVGNPGEINGTTGIDDDGNGKIDDIYGWDFQANNNTVYDGYTDDHGSHVAGILGAKAGNSIGIAGVSSETRMISAKFLGSSGGTTANAIAAFNYLADLKQRGVNIVAINCSWGGGGYSSAMYTALSNLNDLSILVVCAAGNNGTNAGMYPAAYDLPNILSVAAIDSTGTKSSFSNYGTTWVDVAAPGRQIISTIPTTSNGSTYAFYDGTSMATPFVTGMALVLARMFPTATHLDIKNAILGSVTKTTQLANQVASGGYVNLPGAIQYLSGAPSDPNVPPNPTPTPTPPSAPTELWGTAGSDPNLAATTETIIGGVTQNGTDTGRGTMDVVTGNGTPTTYILGDTRRGIFYNDGNNRDIGGNDYLRITNLSAGDTLQLRSGNYIYSINPTTNTVSLYADIGRTSGSLDTAGSRRDELIAIFDNAGGIMANGLTYQYV